MPDLIDTATEDAEQMARNWLALAFHSTSTAQPPTQFRGLRNFLSRIQEEPRKNFSLAIFDKTSWKKPKLLISLSLPKRLNSVYTEAVGRD